MSQCHDCTPGFYCNASPSTAPVAPCDAGYYCPGKDSSPQSIPCPAGSYCPAGSSQPIACPQGTYSVTSESTSDADCSPCPAGYYCGVVGQVGLSAARLCNVCPSVSAATSFPPFLSNIPLLDGVHFAPVEMCVRMCVVMHAVKFEWMHVVMLQVVMCVVMYFCI